METILDACRITSLGSDACRNVLLVGELNPYGAQPGYALYYQPENSAGGRLQRLILGLAARRWYLPIWRTNLCVGTWDDDEARQRMVRLTSTSAPWRTIVLLGKRVAAAYSSGQRLWPGVDPFVVRQHATISTAITAAFSILPLPHPSGRNASSWHDADIERAREILRKLEPAIPWGHLEAAAAAEVSP